MTVTPAAGRARKPRPWAKSKAGEVREVSASASLDLLGRLRRRVGRCGGLAREAVGEAVDELVERGRALDEVVGPLLLRVLRSNAVAGDTELARLDQGGDAQLVLEQGLVIALERLVLGLRLSGGCRSAGRDRWTPRPPCRAIAAAPR